MSRKLFHSRKDSHRSQSSAGTGGAVQESQLSPKGFPPVVQRLQDMAGNRATGQWLQAKLKVSASSDFSEREAERTADHVLIEAPARLENAPQTWPITGRTRHREGACSNSGSSDIHADALPIVYESLDFAGRPLDSATRAFFEPRFGQDFSGVRIHTGDMAARSADAIAARAFTSGEHIVFNEGQYDPSSGSGRHLIAHELTHVLQQGGNNKTGLALRAGPAQLVQRSPQDATVNQTPPTKIPNTSRDRDIWISRVDTAIRNLFKLSGTGLTSANVHFLNQKNFATLFKGQTLEDKLFSLFVDFGYNPHICPNETPFGAILDFNHVTYGTVGYFDPEGLGGSKILDELRDFVRQGISRGFFMGKWCGPMDVVTKQLPAPQKFTPAELITRFIPGITDITGPPRTGQVNLQGFKEAGGEFRPDVSTLFHEACHFYVSNHFRDMAQSRKDGASLIGGERISEVLMEGFAEYFAREAMGTNPKLFGPVTDDVYPLATKNAATLIWLMGEKPAQAAYFGGVTKQIAALSHLVDEWKQRGDDFPEVDVITGADPKAERPRKWERQSNP